MTVFAYPPDRRTRDLGNLDKALSDALQFAGVIADDGDIDDLHYIRGGVYKGGRLKVMIEEIPGGATETLELLDEVAA
jgi:crossover junction endodeoxyribonuclease RusA